MKRIAIYIAILLLVATIPVKRTDIGKLRPVQTVMLYRQENDVVIKTDTGDKGVGTGALEALENLKQTTPAVIYLDTADFLLVSEDALDALQLLRDTFRGSVELYLFSGDIDPSEASKYLQIHGDGLRLKRWNGQTDLQILRLDEKRLILS